LNLKKGCVLAPTLFGIVLSAVPHCAFHYDGEHAIIVGVSLRACTDDESTLQKHVPEAKLRTSLYMSYCLQMMLLSFHT